MFDCRSLFGEKGVMKKLTNAMGVAFFGLVAVWMFCLSLVSAVGKHFIFCKAAEVGYRYLARVICKLFSLCANLFKFTEIISL